MQPHIHRKHSDSLDSTYISLLVVTNSRDLSRLTQSLSPLLQGNDGLWTINEFFDGRLEPRKFFSDILHFTQELFAIIESEVGNRISRVKFLIFPAIDMKYKWLYTNNLVIRHEI